MADIKDCSCEACIGGCNNQPGWFAPGEAEKAALLLKIPFNKFKEKFLITDYWVGDPDIDVLQPRKVGQDIDKKRASFSSAFNPGTCVFLENNLCKIHEAKPYECRHTMCCDEKAKPLREEIKDMWRDLK